MRPQIEGDGPVGGSPSTPREAGARTAPPPPPAGRRPLRLIVFDATDTASIAIPRVERREDGAAQGTGGLTRYWRLGAALHRIVARADRALGATSWRAALRFAIDVAAESGRPIGELQAWGHGGWGYMGMGRERLDLAAIRGGGALAPEVSALRASLAPGALFWLRCCSAFGAAPGRAFAPELAERLGARVAGHTFIIGVFQSGTHSLQPGDRPTWSEREGVEARRGATVARVSSPGAPNTVTCLHPGLPDGY